VRNRSPFDTPDYWKVLLVRARGDVVGVSGLYRQPGMPHNVCWIGWFGIRPRFRREGFGTSAMHALMDVARNIGYQELWVYTGSSDDAAVCFYKSLGFKVLGSARLGPWTNDGRFGHRAEANALVSLEI
jgi:ribosomal protein S18 acetylase RimI-like enzyme